MRFCLVAALAFGLAACGGGGGEELAAGNSTLNQAEIDAALGPADQSEVQDAVPAGGAEADVSTNPDADSAGNAADGGDED